MNGYEFVGDFLEGVKNMPDTWADALKAVIDGTSSVMTIVTESTLLMALSFGFVFLRKAVGTVKRLIKLGGKG